MCQLLNGDYFNGLHDRTVQFKNKEEILELSSLGKQEKLQFDVSRGRHDTLRMKQRPSAFPSLPFLKCFPIGLIIKHPGRDVREQMTILAYG